MSTREEEKVIHRRQCVTSYGSHKKTFNVFEDAVEWASIHNTLLYHKEKIYEL